MFVGIVESVVDLQRIRGLLPATDEVSKLSSPRPQRCLIEAVVSNSCPLVGKTIRDGRFRNTYNAVVVAVARNGERLHKKIGDIVLRAGDTLLVEAHPSFADQQRNSRDFFLVSRLEDSNPPRHDRAFIAMGLLLAMVLAVSFEWMSMLKASMLVAGLMIFARCITTDAARRSIDWEVLLAIAASFALGTALEKTGAARDIAERLITAAARQPLDFAGRGVRRDADRHRTDHQQRRGGADVSVSPSTRPTGLGVNYMPFVIAVMMAASAGFATPIGYQTNLMVYGPGGYRFSDYLRIGVPLDILIWVITVAIAPLVWPFYAR